MTSIQPRPSATIPTTSAVRDTRAAGAIGRTNWERITEATKSLEQKPSLPDAPLFTPLRKVSAAKAPTAADLAPLANTPPEQLLAQFSRIELLLDRAVAASHGQKPELELGRTAIASHVRRMMMLQAGRDGLVGS